MKSYMMAFSMSVLLAACGGSEPKAAAAASEAQAPKSQAKGNVYQVVTEQSYPPFTLHDGKGNSLGFEVELLQEIGKRKNLQFEFTPQVWGGILDAVKTGKADVAAAGLTVLEERKADMLFTEPHFTTETALIVSDKLPEIQRFADIRGKKVAVKKGSLQHQILLNLKHDPSQAVFVDTAWRAVASTMNGDSDAGLADWGALMYYNQQYKDKNMRVVRDANAAKEEIAFAIKKDNSVLQQAINAGLAQMKQDGSYQALHQKWFGMAAQ